MPKIKKGNMPVPQTWAGQDKRFGETLKNNVDVLAGFNGDPLDKAVTMRALLDSGIVSLASGYGAYSGASSSIAPRVDIPNLDVPPAPYNLAANGAFQNILLSWSLAGFRGLAYQEVFRHTSDIIADATLLGVVSATRGFYTDSVGESSSYYYWVRAVNQNGVAGPFNSSTGTLGETAPDVQLLLNTLNGAITASELATDLTTTLDGFATEISDLETTYGTTASAAASAAAAAASESAAIAAEASALGANTTAIAAKVAALLAQKIMPKPQRQMLRRLKVQLRRRKQRHQRQLLVQPVQRLQHRPHKLPQQTQPRQQDHLLLPPQHLKAMQAHTLPQQELARRHQKPHS